MLNRSFNMLNVVERWCSIPFKKEMLLVGWTTTLPAFCWATNVKRCWTVVHWLIGLTQMTKASVKTDYFNKCGLRPDTLRLNLQIKVVNSNFLITWFWWLDLFRTERNLCFCLMLTSRILQMMRDVKGYRECLSIHLVFNHSEGPSSKWQRSNSLGERNFLTFNRSLYCRTCFRPTVAAFFSWQYVKKSADVLPLTPLRKHFEGRGKSLVTTGQLLDTSQHLICFM